MRASPGSSPGQLVQANQASALPGPMKLEEKLEFVESTPRIWETWFYSLHSTPSFHSSSTRKRSKVFESLRLLWILAEILRTSSWCSERNRVSCETVEISCLSMSLLCTNEKPVEYVSNLKNYELSSCVETFIFWKILEFCVEFDNWQCTVSSHA